MRLLSVALLVLSSGLFVSADDKKEPAKPETRKDQLKALQTKFDEELNGLVKKIQSAKTAAEQNAVRTEARETATITLGKILKLAQEDPKDSVALDACQFAMTRLLPIGVGGPDVDKIVGIVVDNHLSSPKVKEMLMMAGRLGASGEKLLNAAAEKSTDKETKGTALYFLGSSLAEQADDAPNEKAGEEMTRKAIDYLERAAKEAPDAKIGRETIGKLATAEAVALKTLGVNKPAPDVEGTDLNGKVAKLSSFKGQVVLLDIWATWCPPCRAMIPHERKLVESMKDKPFTLISVSADNEKDTLVKFIEKEPMPWTHWWVGADSSMLKTFRVKAFPTLYLIDANGVVRKKWIGSPSNEVLDKAIEELVKSVAKG